MRRLTTFLDLGGIAGLAVAAGFWVNWMAGLAVASVAALLVSWRASS
jgi:hypothetical protein